MPIIALEVMYDYRQLLLRLWYSVRLITPTMRSTPIIPPQCDFVPSKQLVVYVTVGDSVEGAQLYLGKLSQLLGSSNALLKQLFCFLLQFAHKHLLGILSLVGDKRHADVRYHTTHHLVCKAAWEVLLEWSQSWFMDHRHPLQHPV